MSFPRRSHRRRNIQSPPIVAEVCERRTLLSGACLDDATEAPADAAGQNASTTTEDAIADATQTVLSSDNSSPSESGIASTDNADVTDADITETSDDVHETTMEVGVASTNDDTAVETLEAADAPTPLIDEEATEALPATTPADEPGFNRIDEILLPPGDAESAPDSTTDFAVASPLDVIDTESAGSATDSELSSVVADITETEASSDEGIADDPLLFMSMLESQEPEQPLAAFQQDSLEARDSRRSRPDVSRREGRDQFRRNTERRRDPDRPDDAPTEFRSIDGTGNNLENPDLGSTDEQLLRVAEADYGDGISTPAGSDRPSAREISNALSVQQEETASNDRDLSAFLYVWGQFLDHDIDLTETDGGESFNIAVPAGDPFFDPEGTGTQVIPLTRSLFDESTGTGADNPRQQITQITSWIDGSNVYGSDEATAASLRAFEGGRLLIGDDGLLPTDADGNFLAGDVRANENIELTSMHTLFVREHNLQADRIAAENPNLSDEEIYQQARAIVVAEMQAITFNEFLPALLGAGALTDYEGYDSSVDPSIANEFSTAAFRFGHSTLNEDIEFFDDDGRPVLDEVALREAFFNPDLLRETGIDSILKYVASSTAQEIDLQVIDSVRNFLFGVPGQGGFDLVSLNIQRGRDHGLADYNAVREAYGLERVESFADITSDVAVQQTLSDLYGTVDNIDLWVGGLAEDHVDGSSMGELFQVIIADQFQRLRDGDRFWYENTFSGSELREIEQTSLSDIIQRNTEVSNLQDNVFVMTADVSGRVTADSRGRGGRGVAGVEVELLSDEGTVIATTTTDSRGRYRFEQFDETGDYQIRIAATSSVIPAASDPLDVLISRGGLSLRGLNFAVMLPRDSVRA